MIRSEVNGARWPSRSSKSVAASLRGRLGSTPRRFRQLGLRPRWRSAPGRQRDRLRPSGSPKSRRLPGAPDRRCPSGSAQSRRLQDSSESALPFRLASIASTPRRTGIGVALRARLTHVDLVGVQRVAVSGAGFALRARLNRIDSQAHRIAVALRARLSRVDSSAHNDRRCPSGSPRSHRLSGAPHRRCPSDSAQSRRSSAHNDRRCPPGSPRSHRLSGAPHRCCPSGSGSVASRPRRIRISVAFGLASNASPLKRTGSASPFGLVSIASNAHAGTASQSATPIQ